MTLDPQQTEFDLKAIFEYLAASGTTVYLAIDEFQQIMTYPEKGTEAQLRSYVQFIHNVHFIFSGSKLHLMTEMFMSPSQSFRPSLSVEECQHCEECSGCSGGERNHLPQPQRVHSL